MPRSCEALTTPDPVASDPDQWHRLGGWQAWHDSCLWRLRRAAEAQRPRVRTSSHSRERGPPGWSGRVRSRGVWSRSHPYHPTFHRDTPPISHRRVRWHTHRSMPASPAAASCRSCSPPRCCSRPPCRPQQAPTPRSRRPKAAALAYANKQAHARAVFVPLRLDSRLQEIAHGRAVTMATENKMSHVQADGNNVSICSRMPTSFATGPARSSPGTTPPTTSRRPSA